LFEVSLAVEREVVYPILLDFAAAQPVSKGFFASRLDFPIM